MKRGVSKPSASSVKRPVFRQKISLAIVACLAAFGLGAIIVPSAWAMWTAQVQLHGTITVKEAKPEINGTVSIANQTTMISHSTLQEARLLTVTNSIIGTLSDPLQLSLRLSAPETNALSGAKLEVFSVSSADQCSVSATASNAQTGTWKNGVTISNNTLVANSTTLYCARTTVSSWEDLATADGTTTITPAANATFSSGDISKGATASSTLKSVAIYPAVTPVSGYYQMKIVSDTSKCVQAVVSSDTTKTNQQRLTGQALVAGSCFTTAQLATTASYPQQFIFPTATTNRVSIKTKFYEGLVLSAIFDTMITFQSEGTSGANWRIELLPNGSWQFVNNSIMSSSSLCLTVPTSGSDNTLTECLNSANQAFYPVTVNLSRSADISLGSTDSEDNDGATDPSSKEVPSSEVSQLESSEDQEQPQSEPAEKVDELLLSTESQ